MWLVLESGCMLRIRKTVSHKHIKKSTNSEHAHRRDTCTTDTGRTREADTMLMGGEGEHKEDQSHAVSAEREL